MIKAACVATIVLVSVTDLRAAENAGAPLPYAGALQALRDQGDLAGQRRHVWALISYVTRAAPNAAPFFQSWHGEDALFSDHAVAGRGLAGFSRTSDRGADPHAPDVPVLTYTLYNDAAFDHIKRYRLNTIAGLNAFQKSGDPDTTIAGDRAVPAFPADAMVLKTAWWPVAKTGLTALPVWDPDDNPPSPRGNPYTSWRRVVALDPSGAGPVRATTAIDFAGSHFPAARRIGIDALYHVTVDAPMAARMMRDPETRKAVLIALGRPLKAGDYLALVAANLAAREVPDWIWATFWWHDQPGGAFAAQRPATLGPVWNNYLMQTAFDAQKPAGKDGPHIAFDPWLEGRFPDGGHGNGMSSNCMACHQRASYPPLAFLPVTRGPPDLKNDPAEVPGRLRTSFLWSLAMHAKP